MGDIASIRSFSKSAVLHKTYKTPPLAVKAYGIYYDLEDGSRVTDAVGGAAVVCIGNGHPAVVEAIREQAGILNFTFHTQLTNTPTEMLAQNIIDRSQGAFARIAFASGGSEAVEGALKTARQYFWELGQTQRVNYIGRKSSYHGASLGTLNVAWNAARRAPYNDILDSKRFHHVSPAYARRYQREGESEAQFVERLRAELEAKFIELGPHTVIAFVAETVGGASSGVVIPPKGYFAAVRSVCDKYGALLILDEVMCGMGRMGTLHAWERVADGVSPDIQAVAKGLGGGYTPIGGVLIAPRVARVLSEGSGVWQHGYTYQAHPLCSAASLAVQRVIIAEKLLENCTTQGDLLGTLLKEKLEADGALARNYVAEIRGAGLFWAIEFDASALDLGGKRFAFVVEERCFQAGLMVMGMSGGANIEGTQGDHIMFAPAYNITADEVRAIVDVVVGCVEEVVREGLAKK
ncbi:unnamed protein product [Mycena citricolor]|uniref:Aminotransferase n=1 Tax=Mycena citricolor TaxID=2018698 RepID=A0AAD2K4V7_9AGAR|nr:unnamed protein product [Mycena citricolor]CAK5278783.1 unnamed protein product [Mycena citricolor]